MKPFQVSVEFLFSCLSRPVFVFALHSQNPLSIRYLGFFVDPTFLSFRYGLEEGGAGRTNGLDLPGQELEVMSAKARESETQQPCQSQQTLPISFPKELCDSLSSKPPIRSKTSQRSHNIHASNLPEKPQRLIPETCVLG